MKTTNFLREWAEAAHSLAERLGGTLVVLGRDAWPLVAYLRATGRKCQYFLASRLQVGDESTKARWLAEVQPGAVVVDTGYAGTIPRWLADIDPTIRGAALMSAAENAYCSQLNLSGSQSPCHDRIVSEIERIPKAVARCTGYTADGTAEFHTSDSSDVDQEGDGRLSAPVQSYLLLREMGLDSASASRYAGFTGVMPAERIGCSRHEVREHLLQVRRARQAADKIGDVVEYLRHVERLNEFDAAEFAERNFAELDENYRDVARLWSKTWSAWQRAKRRVTKGTGSVATERRRRVRHERIAATHLAWQSIADWQIH